MGLNFYDLQNSHRLIELIELLRLKGADPFVDLSRGLRIIISKEVKVPSSMLKIFFPGKGRYTVRLAPQKKERVLVHEELMCL